MRNDGTFPRIALLLTVTGAVACLAGCGSGRPSAGTASASDASYLAAVERAADVTDNVPGYKFATSVTVNQGGKSVTADGSGWVNARGSEGTIHIELDGKTVQEIIAAPDLYMEVPSGAKASVTHGKRWVSFDLTTITQSVGDSSLGSGSSDPAQMLTYLKSAGTVTRVGSEEVRGTPSTHYHALVDLDRLASAAPAGERPAAGKAAQLLIRITGSHTLPMDVWIGDDGRVTRVAENFSLCLPEGRLQESTSTDLYGYGQQPAVSPPPASEVTDIDGRMKSAITKALASLSCG